MIKEKDTTWILLDDNMYSYSGSHNKNIKFKDDDTKNYKAWQFIK